MMKKYEIYLLVSNNYESYFKTRILLKFYIRLLGKQPKKAYI